MTPTSTPSPVQALLLRAALLGGEAARDAWTDWRARVDLDTLDPESQRLLPLLWRNLRRAGVRDGVPGRLAGVYKLTWTRNTYAFRAATRALRALHAAGVPTMMIKGTALTLLHYRDSGVRHMDDVDVMVPRARVRDAIAAILANGYEGAERSENFFSTHHSSLFGDRKGGMLDLHWHAAQDALRASADEPLWAAAVPLVVDDVHTRALCPTDLLFHVISHAYHSQTAHLRWIPDAATILATAEVDPVRLLDVARARGFVVGIRLALELLRDRIGVPVPAALAAAFAAEEAPFLERLEHQLNVSSRPYTVGKVFIRLWCWHRRSSDARGLGLVAGFPDFLRRYYDAPSVRMLPALGVERVRKRLQDYGVF